MSDNNIIITIGRETGSGGREIGRMLASRLGIDYYDRELIQVAAKNSGLCEEVLESYDERPTSSFLYSLVMDGGTFGSNLPINHKVFLAQFDAIRHIADKGSCVIVGRCADYALSEYTNKLSVFITGTMEAKALSISKRNQLSIDKAKDFVMKSDKKRANYYNFYTGRQWGHAKTYDLCVNSSNLGYENTVDLIISCLNMKNSR